MRYFSKIWEILGNTKFSVFVFYLTSSIALIGSIYMKNNPNLFFPLKYSNIHEWMTSYGIRNLSYTWWIPALFVFLFIVAICVFVCSLNLIKDKFLFLSHIGFLIVLIGLFISHTFSSISTGNILTKGSKIKLPSGILLKLEDIKITYIPEKTLFLGKAKDAFDCSAVLLIKDHERVCKKEVALNRPCFYKGLTIFIEDFYPRQKMKKANCWINLTFRKDYGIPILFAGSLMFLSGIFGVLLR